MAQEVQTTLNYKRELNLIEGVGHQENKVREHTQIEQAFGYECAASSSMNLSVTGGVWTEEKQTTIAIDSMSGGTEFLIRSKGLRIPLAGPYLAHLEFSGGASLVTVRHYIKVDGEILYYGTTKSQVTPTIVEKILNLGRYNVIEHRVSGYYDYSPGIGTTTEVKFNITLKKL